MSNAFVSQFRRAFDPWHKIQNVAFSKNDSFENESGGLQTNIQNNSITLLHSPSSSPIVGTKLTLETMPQALAVGGHAL